jgi:formate dehydrogenase major subunit
MACPGGCICGAGHPIPEKTGALSERQNVLVTIDSQSPLRRSHENPDILRLYTDFYGSPNSSLAHKFLHTHYTPFREGKEGKVRNAQDSAFVVHQMRVCVCDKCKAMGSEELYNDLQLRIHALKMTEFLEAKSFRMGESHNGDEIFISIDGKRVAVDKLGNLYRSLREIAPLTPHWYTSRP